MDQRYLNLRRRLDHLGYRQPFASDSLSLVEKLLTDLVQQTDHLKSIHRDPTLKKYVYCNGPCSCDHSSYENLVKENNELHRQVIKIKEDCDKDLKALTSQLRKIESQNVDLQFLNNEYFIKIQQLEKESKLKSDKLQEYQEKNLQAIIQTSAKKNSFPFRHQRLDIDALVPPSAAKPVQVENLRKQSQDMQYVNLLQVANHQIAQLNSELDAVKLTNEQGSDVINSLKKKVEVTNNENERLTHLLESKALHYKGMHIDNMHAYNDHHVVAHLNFEIEHLKRLNQDLEKQLKQAINASREVQAKTSNLTSQNRQLELELNDVDKIAQGLKKQKDELVSVADKEMNEAKLEVEKLYKEIERLKEEGVQLKNERDSLFQDKARLSSALTDCESKQKMLTEASEHWKKSAVEIEERLRKMTVQYDELNEKLNKVLTGLGSSENPSLESYRQQIVQSIEKQRDYYKEQAEIISLQLNGKLLNDQHSTSTPIGKHPFPGFQVDPLVKLLEEERDLYKIECLKLKSGMMPQITTSNLESNQVVELQHQIREVIAEKEELNRTLESLEKHIGDLNNNLQYVTQDRDKLKELYEKQKRLMENTKTAVPRTATSGDIINQAQRERDIAKAEFQRLLTENEEYKNRLKLATETQISERRRLEKRITDAEAQLFAGSIECAELLTKNSSYQAVLASQEDQLKGLQTQILELQNEAMQERSRANRLQMMAQQADKTLKDSQRILTQNVSEKGQVEKRVQDLEAQIDRLNQVINQQRDEVTSLQKSRLAIDKEKDAFQMDVDYKTEQIDALQQELAKKAKEIADLKFGIGNLESRLNLIMDELQDKERDMKALKRQVETAKRELEEAGRSREEILRQVRHLQDDMMVMTRENQALERDLHNANDEQDQLKRQIQQYVAEVSQAEELLRDKEQERTDLLEQYQALTTATTNLESHKSHLESEANSSRTELLAKETELRHSQDIINALNLEVENHLARQRESDMQILNLHQNLNSAETRLQECQRERDHLQRDMLSMRELCVKLDSNKDNLSDDLRNKDSEIEKMKMSVFDQQQHLDSLTLQLSAQKQEVESLEHLLATNRQKEFHTELENRDLSDELRMIKDRLDKVEAKLEEQTQNATRYRNRVTELEIEVERLKRQLTNEQFERERLNQELRRNRQGRPGSDETSPSNVAATAIPAVHRETTDSPPFGTYSRSVYEYRRTQDSIVTHTGFTRPSLPSVVVTAPRTSNPGEIASASQGARNNSRNSSIQLKKMISIEEIDHSNKSSKSGQ